MRLIASLHFDYRIHFNHYPYFCEMEERLDKLLMQLGLVNSRGRAEQIITEFGVKVNGKLIQKVGKKVPVDAKIEMITEDIPWISVDALKIQAAAKEWNLPLADQRLMDVGCMQGGFSEYFLAEQAKQVIAQDNGKQALHPSLKAHPQLVSLEGTPLRSLTNQLIPEKIDGCAINSTFLSLEKVFPFLHGFLNEEAWLIAIIRPAFDADRSLLKHDGTLRDAKDLVVLIETLKKIGERNNLIYQDVLESPVLGGNGQKENLIYFKKKSLV